MSGRIMDIPSVHFRSLSKLETSYWWHISRLNWAEKILCEYLSDISKVMVVDYGCGTGGFLHELHKRMGFGRICGLDVSENAVGLARQYGDCFHSIEMNDFGGISNNDLVLLMDVLEHIEDDRSFLTNMLNSMKLGAKLLISVPALGFLYSTWDETLGHYRRYSKKNITDMVTAAGGRVRFIKYCFTYLVPAVLFRKVAVGFNRYNEINCEFPTVSRHFNTFLIALNRAEMSVSRFIPDIAGSSLMCLVEK